MESILTSIKKLLGISEEYTQFDTDIIIHINSVFMALNQLGVGPSEGFYIEDALTEWTDYISDPAKLQAVKTYMYLKVRLLFDPSSLGSATLAVYERQIMELEWRLNMASEVDFANLASKRGIELTDRSTNTTYELYVNDSKLTIEEGRR